MRRRDFITLLGSIAPIWSFVANAQQSPKLPTVGFLCGAARDDWASLIAAFREGLSDAGYVEGRNVVLIFRFAEYHYDRLPAMALDLVRQGVDVIFASVGDVSVEAALAATKTIPIVFTSPNDPVAAGWVESLHRPGGNITGVTFLAESLDAKRIELLHEMDPKAASVAVLVGPLIASVMQGATIESEIEGAAKTLSLNVRFVRINNDDDIIPAFKDIAAHRDDAIHIMPDPLLDVALGGKLAALAAQAGLPITSVRPDFPAAGGLLSYGASATSIHRIAGTYVGRILKGEKPANLPVQQSTTEVKLIINLKTAKALGLTVPPSLLARADELIE